MRPQYLSTNAMQVEQRVMMDEAVCECSFAKAKSGPDHRAPHDFVSLKISSRFNVCRVFCDIEARRSRSLPMGRRESNVLSLHTARARSRLRLRARPRPRARPLSRRVRSSAPAPSRPRASGLPPAPSSPASARASSRLERARSRPCTAGIGLRDAGDWDVLTQAAVAVGRNTRRFRRAFAARYA